MVKWFTKSDEVGGKTKKEENRKEKPSVIKQKGESQNGCYKEKAP